MQIYLFRHGIADDPKPGSPDSSRKLTQEGRRRARAMCTMAQQAGVSASLILTSPYTRARETAALAEAVFQCPVVVTTSLVPEGSPQAVWSDLRDHNDESAILLASHEPLMSTLAAWLLDSPGLRIEMKKSGLIRIDVERVGSAQPHGILRWMAIPALLKNESGN